MEQALEEMEREIEWLDEETTDPVPVRKRKRVLAFPGEGRKGYGNGSPRPEDSAPVDRAEHHGRSSRRRQDRNGSRTSGRTERDTAGRNRAAGAWRNGHKAAAGSGKNQQHIAVMLALISVIALSGGILLLLVAQNYAEGRKQDIAEGTAVADQLGRIQGQLDNLDETVRNDTENGTIREDGYEELSGTVADLKNGLVEYRNTDAGSSQEVSENLDHVIARLNEIESDMEQARAQTNEELGQRIDTLGSQQDSSEADLVQNIESVRDEIRTLLSDAGKDADKRNTTVVTAFEETGKEIRDSLAKVQGSADSQAAEVSALRQGVSEANAALSSQKEQMSQTGQAILAVDGSVNKVTADVASVGGNVTAIGNSVNTLQGTVTEIGNSSGRMETQLTGLDERLDSSDGKLDSLQSDVSDLSERLDEISRTVGELKETSGNAAPAATAGQMEEVLSELRTLSGKVEALEQASHSGSGEADSTKGKSDVQDDTEAESSAAE